MLLGRIELDEEELIAHGAEAKLYTSQYLDYPVVCKKRLEKPYRDPAIDFKLRKERTTQEVRLLQILRENEVPVPWVYDLRKDSWTIVMEHIKGIPLKKKIHEIDITDVFERIGKFVGIMHTLDIIHGDLTTSNILLKDNQVYFIDFGLGYISTQIEDKAVDLLVLKHTLESSHPEFNELAFEAFLKGYRRSNEEANIIEKRYSIVEGRVRYRTHG